MLEVAEAEYAAMATATELGCCHIPVVLGVAVHGESLEPCMVMADAGITLLTLHGAPALGPQGMGDIGKPMGSVVDVEASNATAPWLLFQLLLCLYELSELDVAHLDISPGNLAQSTKPAASVPAPAAPIPAPGPQLASLSPAMPWKLEGSGQKRSHEAEFSQRSSKKPANPGRSSQPELTRSQPLSHSSSSSSSNPPYKQQLQHPALGGTGFITVLDFGCCHFLSSLAPGCYLQQPVTLRYTSPELLTMAGGGRVQVEVPHALKAADMWSAAACFIYAWTGKSRCMWC